MIPGCGSSHLAQRPPASLSPLIIQFFQGTRLVAQQPE